jgi:hypothetical protein
VGGYQTAVVQDTKLQWQDTKLQWQDTKLHARCVISRSGRSPNCDNGAYCTLAIAMQPCPAALPGSLARQPCPAALPGRLAEILQS